MTAVTTHSTAQTEEAAAALGPYLKDGDVLLQDIGHGGNLSGVRIAVDYFSLITVTRTPPFLSLPSS